MSEPTKGTWSAVKSASKHGDWHVVSNDFDMMGAVAKVPAQFCGEDAARANARAMATSKDMLKILKIFVDHEVDYMTRNKLGDPESQHRVKQARAAIAKATGGGA